MRIEYLNLSRIHNSIRSELDAAYHSVLNNEWFIRGEYCRKFEEAFSKYCNVSYCVGVGNGLDAISLILKALNIGEGDEVIVPANTFIASILAITEVGATPVLVDASYSTLNIDISQIEKKITKKTKARIVVHLYGRMVDMLEVSKIANKHNLFLIEDAAQAHGATQNGKRAGCHGVAGAFSFYPGKNLGSLGDAGAVVTNDKNLAERVKEIANYGSKEKYVHNYIGVNSRMDELQAAFLLVKLKYLDDWNIERRRIGYIYCSHILNSKINITMKENEFNSDNVVHIFPILVEERERLLEYLNRLCIQVCIHYPVPIYNQLAYKEMNWHDSDYVITNRICNTEVSIPLYPGLNAEEIDYICNALCNYK